VSKATTDVLLWAQRIMMRRKHRAFELLDLGPSFTLDQAQEAFHRIARMAHPDLHRTTLDAAELETVTRAYAQCAAAYQTIRTQLLKVPPPPQRKPGDPPSVIQHDFNDEPPTPPPVVPPPPPLSDTRPPPAVTPALTQMSPKALVYYRKAELALRRGDITSAMMQIKMSIAADPNSKFLRAALQEIQVELGKKS
jgi:hypothetical protein